LHLRGALLQQPKDQGAHPPVSQAVALVVVYRERHKHAADPQGKAVDISNLGPTGRLPGGG
jgi:hypothetical protein